MGNPPPLYKKVRNIVNDGHKTQETQFLSTSGCGRDPARTTRRISPVLSLKISSLLNPTLKRKTHQENMKGSCTLVASVLTVSTVALSSSAPPSSHVVEGSSRSSSMEKSGGSNKEKFAPRFDGLRFIETLVTAHR
ncbi:hypothetical protein NC653_004437 [Populus alba x Populus x berolinensis]|uniref:Uncharacterized protein n=1 Tax=Populus alba x Populus x berolinensis TaxID=444605 RepID=A0AAD6RV13_9ROSI|nr:hypothetical protein NC653_004437 [Populus alba x Populus x berolinensis]